MMGWNNVMDFGTWWTENEDSDLCLFAMCVFDVLWFWRNNIIHNHKEWDFQMLFKDCLSRFQEFSSMKPKLDLTLDGKVDASVLGSEAGIAAILKSDGVWSEAFAALNFIHVSSMLEGELAAISLALTAAKNKGFDKISIESDCSAEIRGLNSGSFPIGWGYPIFSECLVKIKDFVSVDFIYINRSIKSFTDLLAHGACVEKIHAFGCIREVAPFVVTTLC
ncbi:hypothetical protein F8388_001665 [Cannabis sativa]|uniref:RNase H type-1 domain-containing protein n=1 Tax=Cannabis sativa TaxID=3483 RepID=A0A7J6HKQ5_CANSA|nr:hypothetical protein F8388_001665 [Cannabis sativa]